jgi:tetratricopeptide (TPR) repeat protein
MKRLAWSLGLCLALSGSASAAVPDAGTQNPFELGAGARALGMSGAYVGVADDATAMFWNPAGLARLDRAEVTGMHINLYFGTPYDFLGAAYPLLDWGTFSLGAVRVATSGIVLRDEESFVIGAGEGSYDLREYLVGYGRELPLGLRAGAVVKVDQMRLLGSSASGVDLDLGLQFQLPGSAGGWERLCLGVSAQNVLATPQRLDQEADLLPLNLRLGASYPLAFGGEGLPQSLLTSVELDKSTWRSWQWRAGLEYGLRDLFFLRGGLQSDAWSAGAGLQYAGLALDYALAGQELGLTHRFSLSWQFGPRLSEQRAERERQRQEELDREAARRAEAAVQAARTEMEQEVQRAERKYQRERQALLAKQQQRVDQAVAEERQRQGATRAQELEREYFKSLHYFQGIKDFLAKRYAQAITEFETVAKVDPNYLETQFYLARARQLAKGQATVMSEPELDLYYQGINLYLDNKYAEAIAVWKRMLEKNPTNVLVMRNIEEAEGRLATLNSPAPAEKAPGAPTPGAKPAP